MATPFSDINDIFYSLITDSDLARMAKEETEENLLVYMKLSIALKFKRCKKNLKDLDIVLRQFKEDLDEEEKSIIAIGMIIYWLSPRILHEENLQQRLGDRDYKTFSGANLLEKMTELKKTIEVELRSYLNSYYYNNFKGYGRR